jgi:superfamily I DNA/RNA helicase
MDAKDWLENLNEQQREAVTFRAGPLLVLAGPGSGKTRIIIHRIAWLVKEQDEAPERILAVTFTNRAAEEMRERLFNFLGDAAEGVWIHTFHAAAMRILRKYGDRIDIPTDFIILDEDEQRQQIARQLRLLNLSREQLPVGEIASRIGQMKSQLINPEQPGEGDDPAMTAVIRAYENWLRDHRALDFDDLLRYAVLLLRRDEEVRAYYRHALGHILVDEYQDINRAQYEFLTLLAPLQTSVTAVADDDQTIYGWRGSDPSFIDAFISHYNPTIIKLPYSYRCPPAILYGAQHLIAREDKAEARRRYMQSKADGDDTPIYHYIFRNISQEQQWLVALIKKLMAERGYHQGDIAILYRTHRLAGPVEQTLLEAGFNVQRVRPKSFFDRHQAREITRYLQMTRALTEDDFSSIINFPVHQVDELTMVQLRRLAGVQGVNLVELVRRVDEFPEISPLTRRHLRRMSHLAEGHLPDLDSDAAQAVQAIFAQLDALRSPWRQSERDALARFLDRTRSPEVVDRLTRALESDQPLVIRHDESLDGRMAAFIFRTVLRDYLGVTVAVNPAAPPANALVIFFGDQQHAGDDGTLTPPASLDPTIPQSVWAWRWAQQLLLSREQLAEGRYIVYDVETTGSSVRRDELVEIGALAYEKRQPAEAPFRALIRPRRGYIPKAATRVHNINYQDVENAPTIDRVLPEFLDYIGSDTLVGHNIARFDNRFIDKACGEYLDGRGFYPLYVDTLRLARRLLPDMRHYSLAHLSQTLGLHKGPIRHRALDDLRVTADLFYLLTDYLLADKEREALSEYLPLVGASLLTGEKPAGEADGLLLDAAARMIHAGNGRDLLDLLAEALPDALQDAVQQAISRLTGRQPRPTEEDHQWQELQDLFLHHVEAFRKYGRDHSLRAFLDYQSLLTSMDAFAHEADEDAITMMTLHNAKGVEYPVVIIVGVEQENLPIWRSLGDPEKLAEERRVLYVGITRAKNAVYLFSTNDREDGFYRDPSRFTFEIPAQYIRHFRIFSNGKVQEIKRTPQRKHKARSQ